MVKINFEAISAFLESLQDDICKQLETVSGSKFFIQDDWVRDKGGGGRSRVMEMDPVFEKAGVNVSVIYGDKLPETATIKRTDLEGRQFWASGLSLVIHPDNPFVPTTHMNVRFFCAEKNGYEPIWWFGGGFDLTPCYPFLEDVIHWHQVAKKVCDLFDPDCYQLFKKWCDDYFYLKHRNESRGVGGIFFDDLNNKSFDDCFDFVKHVGSHFCKAYLPLVKRRQNTLYTQHHKDFQNYRRGRYVEFNLIQDRGTLFGLQTGGRTESILMSMPPVVNWKYNWNPESGSEEAKLYEGFLKPKAWI